MHPLLHTVCAVVAVPYIALALFFLFVGQVARSKGMLAVIGTVWDNFFFYFTKGMFIAPVLWIGLVAMGFFPALQRTGSICVCLLAAASLAVIFFCSSTRLELGQILFLVPCFAVALLSLWLALRGHIAT